MAHDYEDIFDIENLSNEELQQLVHDLLRESRAVDVNEITIRVPSTGSVVLSGRVGTDEERRIALRIVSDRLGIERVEDRMIVDSSRRAESPEAADENAADEALHDSLLLGERAPQDEDEASYLDADEEGEENGTIDRTKSMEEGIPWRPPDSPTPEGEEGTGTERDAGRDSY